MVKKLLLGDIGGTNTFLGVGDSHNLFKIKEFKTKDVNIEDEIKNFISNEDVVGVSLAVAGPVIDKKVKLTNVNKTFSADVLSASFKLDVLLVNDFEALGFFVKHEGVNRGLVVGAGTGLGKVIVSDSILSSEGGREDFPFFSDEFDLKDFFYKKLNRHPSYEDIVSGRGLSLLKEFYSDSSLNKAELLPKNIFLNNRDSLNKKVIGDFSRFYGRFIKNSSLDCLPEKIFIAGGIARKNPWILESDDFLDELKVLPIKYDISLINDKYAGLKGAAFAFYHKNI